MENQLRITSSNPTVTQLNSQNNNNNDDNNNNNNNNNNDNNNSSNNNNSNNNNNNNNNILKKWRNTIILIQIVHVQSSFILAISMHESKSMIKLLHSI